jgi:hypothetical protein
MLHIAFFCLAVAQIPPPPAPLLPESNAQSSAESALTDPKAQREWLLAYLTQQTRAQGKLDAKKYREIEKMVNNVQDNHLGKLIRYYQDHNAQPNLGHSQASGDSPNREVQWKIAISRQEQAQGDMRLSPQLPPWLAQNVNVAQQAQRWAIQDAYTIQPWQYSVDWPHYYTPFPHYRHHRR